MRKDIEENVKPKFIDINKQINSIKEQSKNLDAKI